MNSLDDDDLKIGSSLKGFPKERLEKSSSSSNCTDDNSESDNIYSFANPYLDQTDAVSNYSNRGEDDSENSQLNAKLSSVSSGSRKIKKRKTKRKERSHSKGAALMGWSGNFPNLSSTHSLESNSDLEQHLLRLNRINQLHPPDNTAHITGEDILSAPTAASLLINGSSSLKRTLSQAELHGNQQPENKTKRTKIAKQQVDNNSLRNRSKSLCALNNDTAPRASRSRSFCANAVSDNGVEEAPAKTPAKTPARRRSVAVVKLPPTDAFFCLPFKYGWKRELVLRSNSSRQRGDVIFITPAGKKLRSREDIIPLLKGELTIEHFCFQRQMQQVGEQFETMRHAQPAVMRRKSMSAKQPQQTPLANSNTQQTPVSGKRVPKPKVPKGASPPPEGWTSTMAVKGNARVLAASNGNLSSGAGSSAGNSARKRSNQIKQSPKTPSAGKTQLPSTEVKTMNCVHCSQLIKEGDKAYPLGINNSQSLICLNCFQPGRSAKLQQKPKVSLPTAPGHAANGLKKLDMVDENAHAGKGPAVAPKVQNGEGHGPTNGFGGALLEIGGEIELPGALPPDQLLSDDTPARRTGKITPKPLEVVVINGRKAIAVAGEPPRPRFQVIPRESDLETLDKSTKRVSTAKEKRLSFLDCISSGNQSCQVMTAVMKTLDFHDRVRMSNVCKTWAMIGRDRSVWRTLKLRDTYINNWLSFLRDMARNRTRELDMMGVEMQNPKMRLDGDLRVVRSLRILRTDPSEADFIHTVIKRLPRLVELRTTCTSRVLNLGNMEKMADLQVFRLRMTEPKASLISLQPLQKLAKIKELSLRGINNLGQLDLLHLQGLKLLETLVLGTCRGMKVTPFAEELLPQLKHLRNLRLENHHNNRSFNITEIMGAIAAGGTVRRLELVNVNLDSGFSYQLVECKSVQELLLMPNFHNNTAYLMNYVMQAINENSEQLKVFRLGLTYELLRVTRALTVNHEKDCVPVALPIPGVPENDILNESDEPIAYMPVERLESILHHMMPQAWLTVAKVAQSETTDLKFLSVAPTESVGGL